MRFKYKAHIFQFIRSDHDGRHIHVFRDNKLLGVFCGRLFIRAKDFVNGIELSLIHNSDFESTAPIKSFSPGQSGAVVVCHHKDGEETWLPEDMWEPGGFTPKKA